MLGCWLVALCVISATRYNWFAVCICGAIAIACSLFYAWEIMVVCYSKTGFELVLTPLRLICHSPNQRLCPSFDVELREIDKIIADSDGSASLVTLAGAEIKLSLARNFGVPVRVFVQDIAIQNPHVRLEFSESCSRLN
jgi:hypothetical protein